MFSECVVSIGVIFKLIVNFVTFFLKLMRPYRFCEQILLPLLSMGVIFLTNRANMHAAICRKCIFQREYSVKFTGRLKISIRAHHGFIRDHFEIRLCLWSF